MEIKKNIVMISLIEISYNVFKNVGVFMSNIDITSRFNEKSSKKIDFRLNNISNNFVNIGDYVSANEINKTVNNE